MSSPPDSVAAGRWVHGTPPSNVALGAGTVISGELSFKRFRSQAERALRTPIMPEASSTPSCLVLSGLAERCARLSFHVSWGWSPGNRG